jgi:hypothetical protein
MAIALVGFSAIATAFLVFNLLAFDEAPAAMGRAPSRWPHASGLERPLGTPELLVFAHPFCSCTRASVSELARLASLQENKPNSPKIVFVVFRPHKNSGWQWTALERKISELPRARLVWDDNGAEAKLFDAETSGTVALYDSAGILLFHGGVTGSRGHEGDNYGLSELRRVLDSSSAGQTKQTGVTAARVFGCAIGSQNAGRQADSFRQTNGPSRSSFENLSAYVGGIL